MRLPATTFALWPAHRKKRMSASWSGVCALSENGHQTLCPHSHCDARLRRGVRTELVFPVPGRRRRQRRSWHSRRHGGRRGKRRGWRCNGSGKQGRMPRVTPTTLRATTLRATGSMESSAPRVARARPATAATVCSRSTVDATRAGDASTTCCPRDESSASTPRACARVAARGLSNSIARLPGYAEAPVPSPTSFVCAVDGGTDGG